MHSKYVELFKEIAHTTEVLAEQVMNFNHEKKGRTNCTINAR